MNRSTQAEGTLGVLKSDYDFPKSLIRGKTEVKLRDSNRLHIKIWKYSLAIGISSRFFIRGAIRSIVIFQDTQIR